MTGGGLRAWRWRFPSAVRAGQAARVRCVRDRVKDRNGYNSGFLKDAQKVISEHGGKYVAGGYDKSFSRSGAPLPNRVGILQFESVDAVKGWWAAVAATFRRGSAISMLTFASSQSRV